MNQGAPNFVLSIDVFCSNQSGINRPTSAQNPSFGTA